MTDLCYNCGSCHFPQKCPIALIPCDICKQWGHTWNFCHLGPHQRQPEYQYYALCHNCDRWHLPQPCEKDAYKCRECNQLGHLPFYCPVKPGPRPEAVNGSPERDTGPEDSIRSILSRLTPQEVLHSPYFSRDLWTIEMIAVRDALELAKLYPTEEVYRYLSDAYDGVHLRPQLAVSLPLNMGPPMPPSAASHESPTPRYQGNHYPSTYSNTSVSHGAHSTPANASRFVPNQTSYEPERGVTQMITPISIQGPKRDLPQPTAHDTYQRLAQGLGAYNSPVNGRLASGKHNQDSSVTSSPDATPTSSAIGPGKTSEEHLLERASGTNGHVSSQHALGDGR